MTTDIGSLARVLYEACPVGRLDLGIDFASLMREEREAWESMATAALEALTLPTPAAAAVACLGPTNEALRHFLDHDIRRELDRRSREHDHCQAETCPHARLHLELLLHLDRLLR